MSAPATKALFLSNTLLDLYAMFCQMNLIFIFLGEM